MDNRDALFVEMIHRELELRRAMRAYEDDNMTAAREHFASDARYDLPIIPSLPPESHPKIAR